ncbi:MAG: transglutaminase family protein [Tepidisphaeraceae bacterium]
MKLRVRHTTEYVYGETVPLCHNQVHLYPRDTFRQRCTEHELIISPEPAAVRTGDDFFGNPVSWFSLQEPHRGLTVTANSVVDVLPLVLPTDDALPWEQATTSAEFRPAIEAEPFAFASPYIPIHAALADFARISFTPGRPLVAAAKDLMKRIFTEFKFVPGVTNIGTPVLDVLRDRRGVCQDFTHLMIGCLRSIGLQARYVSGYLLTRPPPGKPKLVGADASHAWVSLFVPGYGWLDLDPTNNVIPSESHVTVGWARDYGDLAPVRGVIVGGHQHSLKVSVDVDEVEEKETEESSPETGE